MQDPDDTETLELFSEDEPPCLCLVCVVRRHEEGAAINETLKEAGLD